MAPRTPDRGPLVEARAALERLDRRIELQRRAEDPGWPDDEVTAQDVEAMIREAMKSRPDSDSPATPRAALSLQWGERRLGVRDWRVALALLVLVGVLGLAWMRVPR